MSTPWDPLHRAYFNGEAMWTYFITPFFLAMNGVRVEETEAWREGEETWRVLRAWFPGSIETHSLVQDFFFGEDLMLRRHDYQGEHRRRLRRRAAHLGLCSGGRHSPDDPTLRPRSATHPGHAHGLYRHHRCKHQLILHSYLSSSIIKF